MQSRFQGTDILSPTHILFVVGLFLICVLLSFLLTTRDVVLVAGAIVALGLFAFSFINPRIALYLLIFSMLLSPEIGARDVSGKGFTIRFEDLLLLIMGFAWLAKSAILKNIGFVTRSPLNFPILLYMFVCIISTMLGIMQGTVRSPATGILFVLKYFEYFVIFFLTVNNIHSKDQMKRLLWAVFITYIIVLAIGLLQIPRGQRITAPFEGSSSEPNTLGGYLLIMFSLTILLFLSVQGRIRKMVIGMLGILCLIAIMFTLSRATWLGFIPMYIMLILISQRRNILILILLVTLAAFPFFLPKVVIERFAYTFRGESMFTMERMLPSGRKVKIDLDLSTKARIESMQRVLKDFQKNPVFGFGITGYSFIDAQYHRVLIECGLIGLMAFAFLLWKTGRILFLLWKQYRADPFYNIITSGTFCAFIGLLFHAIGTNTFIIVRIMEPFWCLVGLCVAIPVIEGEGWKKSEPKPETA
jgi:hypothetical protein